MDWRKHAILHEKQATAYDEVNQYNHKQDEGKLVMNVCIAKHWTDWYDAIYLEIRDNICLTCLSNLKSR